MTIMIGGKPLSKIFVPAKPAPKYDPVKAEQEREQIEAIKVFFKTWCGPKEDDFDQDPRLPHREGGAQSRK